VTSKAQRSRRHSSNAELTYVYNMSVKTTLG